MLETSPVTREQLNALGHKYISQLRKIGAGHFAAATAFAGAGILEAAEVIETGVSPIVSIGAAATATIGGIAKFGYAHRISQSMIEQESDIA